MMDEHRAGALLSRRGMLVMAGAGVASCLRLDAAVTEFWNKRPPEEWTHDEIDRLITKSPWAKMVKAEYAGGPPDSRSGAGGYPGDPNGGSGGGYPGGGRGSGGGYPGGGQSRGGIGIPGIGGLGIPGLGGGGRGRGGNSPRGGGVSPYEGTVRWESARVVLDAMKVPLPEDFEQRYVISVSGIPLMGGRSSNSEGGEDDNPAAVRRHEEDEMDRLKELSSLQVKGRDLVQAGVVKRQVAARSSFLFGFSRDLLAIAAKDAEVVFTTQLGRLKVKARFLPKEMLYHGELAV